MTTLYAKVYEAYINALENDHNLDMWEAEEIAVDMMACDAELESENYSEILNEVRKIKKLRTLKG